MFQAASHLALTPAHSLSFPVAESLVANTPRALVAGLAAGIVLVALTMPKRIRVAVTIASLITVSTTFAVLMVLVAVDMGTVLFKALPSWSIYLVVIAILVAILVAILRRENETHRNARKLTQEIERIRQQQGSDWQTDEPPQ